MLLNSAHSAQGVCSRGATVAARFTVLVLGLGLAVIAVAPAGAAGSAAVVGAKVSLERLVPSVTEGNLSTLAFAVHRIGSTNSALDVYYTVGGTAQPGVDYQALPGLVTIPAGASSASITLTGRDDTVVEPSKTILLTLISNAPPFKLAVLTDSQAYTSQVYPSDPSLFTAMTWWIAENARAQNIAFVLHEGDITETSQALEWQRAKQSISLLDGVVPYALAVGNHDGWWAATPYSSPFNQTFPVAQFQGLPSWGGVFEPNHLENAFYYFTAGGVDWLVLSYEFGPRDEVLAWANQVVATNQNRTVILLSHAHVYSDNTLHGTLPPPPNPAVTAADAALYHWWLPTSYGRWNNGTSVWEKLIRGHANIRFVFNGHVLNEGTGRVVGTNDFGLPVFQMLANYQSLPRGGLGYFRLLEFDPDQDRCAVKTYSPVLNGYMTDARNQFEFEPLNLFRSRQVQYQVVPGQASATLQLLDNDTNAAAPTLLGVMAAQSSDEIVVRFSQWLDAASAEAIENYDLAGAAGIQQAILGPDQQTIRLVLTAPLQGPSNYVLRVSHVAGRAPFGSGVVSNAQLAFTPTPALLTECFNHPGLSPWTVVDEGPAATPAAWSISEARLRQTCDIYDAPAVAPDHPGGTFAYWNDPDAFAWQNYDFAVTINASDDHAVGLLFRFQNPSNYYKLELDQEENFHQLSILTDGVETILAREDGGYPTFCDFHLQVRAFSNQLWAMLEGTNLFGGPITEAGLDCGTVALSCRESADVSFDDVQVTRLTDISPPRLLTSPTNQVVLEEAPVTLEVSVAGADPLFYQWWFNLTNPVPDATGSMLTLQRLQPENVGLYTVTVSNHFGAVTGLVAQVTKIWSDTTGPGLDTLAGVGPDGAPGPDALYLENSTTNGTLRLRFLALAGLEYTIEYTQSLGVRPLGLTNWSPLICLDAAVTPLARGVNVSDAAVAPMRLYRVRARPTP